MVHVVYAQEPLPSHPTKTIFLAGPTPRTAKVRSWRPDALLELDWLGFDGHVFVPEPRDGDWAPDYVDQVEWEEACLIRANCILFWVPRDLRDLPGFTTNDEWGTWKASGKVVWGAPANAEKVRYQEYYARKLGVPMARTLADTARAAVDLMGGG